MIGPCMHKPANMRCVTCIMDTSSFFSNLSIDAKRGLQAHLQLKSISKNELLYKEGDACKHLFILVAGEVKVYKSLINGKHQIHKLAQIPGDIIACEDMFMNAHGSSAQALTDVTVCYLKRSELQQCATANREITDTLMFSMSHNLNLYIKHIANLGQKNALERVASYLVFLHETHNKRNLDNSFLQDSLSRIELADMLGITQRTLIRSLKKLESDQLIQLTRNGFMIHDMDTLTEIGCG
ncbi:MAG TPA: Crp/Fnr family transcriptional regulator [Gammaproteobacteria bacterium]